MAVAFRSFITIFFLFGVGFHSATVFAEDGTVVSGTLRTKNGSILNGRFHPIAKEGFVSWQSDQFAQPFEFPAHKVESVQFPDAAGNTPPQSGFLFEFHSGERLYGALKTWESDLVQIETSEFGVVQVHPGTISRLSVLSESPQVVFPGFAGLTNWQSQSAGLATSGTEELIRRRFGQRPQTVTDQKPNKELWTTEGLAVVTRQPNVALYRDVGVPSKAIIEFEVSWRELPDFVLWLATPNPEADSPLDQGWKFEVWDDTLHVLREQDRVADIAVVEKLSPNKKQISLIAYIDSDAGTLSVYRSNGEPIASLKMPENPVQSRKPKKSIGTGFRLVNRHGDVRLDRLRVSHWNGVLPQHSQAESTRLTLNDGRVLNSNISSLQNNEFNFQQQDDQETTPPVPLKEIAMIDFGKTQAETPTPNTTIILQNGVRVAGTVLETQDGALKFKSESIAAPLSILLKDVRFLGASKFQPAEQNDGSLTPKDVTRGELVINDQRIHGWLGKGEATADCYCLSWHPVEATNSSALLLNAAGYIVFPEKMPLSPSSNDGNQTQANAVPRQRFGKALLKNLDQPPTAPQIDLTCQLHLKSGDFLNCEIAHIDESGVTIASNVSKALLIPHDQIRAIQFSKSKNEPDLEAAKKLRLLTLPRLQKTSPPTHLLCSLQGDFLRCRLLEMDGEKIKVEVHLEEMWIPRNRIAQIIWFHTSEIEEAKPFSPESALPQSNSGSSSMVVRLRVGAQGINGRAEAGVESSNSQGAPLQTSGESFGEVDTTGKFNGSVLVVRRDGSRLSMTPRSVNQDIIAGDHVVLGESQVNLNEIHQIFIGGQISSLSSQLPFQRWKLQFATEPLIAQDQGDGDGDSGTSSALVGQDAPEINLKMVGGSQFKLSEQKGKVIVLDFWATWCGPCLRTMPLLHDLMKNYDSSQVELVSVNLEEPEEQIKSTLERLGLDFKVAMDIDGVAAARYEATSIPQIVVVDQTGKISHLFVEAGPSMIEKLKGALDKHLAPEPDQTEVSFK
ncbi:TlpA family protein disulfide reductase [Planctomicrobium sp. SH668]|uniref:TlpA family protein disulfide reductase n=1 Tax=Planctomicrobium sp. SH668 TaxID=3448126 RepID=UPI003F5C7320